MSYPIPAVDQENLLPEDGVSFPEKSDLQKVADFHKAQMNVIFDALSKSSKTVLKVECKCV